MKNRGILLIFLLIFSLILVSGQEPSAPVVLGQNDVETVQNLQGNFSPLNPDGTFNSSKYSPFVSKAEIRIGLINKWLDTNVFWLKYIFHMKPEISWLFFINLYIILFFFLVLVMNAKTFFAFSQKHARTIGLCIFIILLVVGLYLGIAQTIYNWLKYIVVVMFARGFVAAVITVIILVIIFVLLAIFAPEVIAKIGEAVEKYYQSKREFKRSMDSAINNAKVDALINQVNK